MATILPTGEQYEISAGPYRAVVTEVGATLRSLTCAGRDVIRGFAADAVPSGGAGQELIPWPNRIRDGRYPFAGTEQQLALSEPARHNASHGLVRHAVWRLVDLTESSVTQQVRVFPQPGWPGVLEATLTHSLEAEAGLVVDVTAANLGGTPVPFGYGAHPYLTVGESRVDDVELSIPAGAYLEVDERLLPVAVVDVAGTPFDRRAGGALGSLALDTAFTRVERGSDGRWRVRAQLAERWAELWGDESFGWLQVFTGGPKRDVSVAVEPMSCGPDAFNPGPTHDDLITLSPGAQFHGRWGIAGR
ncbi:MAG TPA: aldose 1-epimerase family protein [Microlunatus sp.]|nr:aldose 1-epimerase family protein [Microlunatus sp.]